MHRDGIVPIRKIQPLGGGDSGGVVLPKSDLRELGVVDEEGEWVDQYVSIESDDDGWRVRPV